MTDDEIAWLDLSTVAGLIRERVLSAEQVTQAQLRRIDRLDPKLHAYARVTSELALRQARAADQRQAQGQALGVGRPVFQQLQACKFTKTLCQTKTPPW
jgi:amidase